MRIASERLAKLIVTWGTPAIGLALSLIQLAGKIILETQQDDYA